MTEVWKEVPGWESYYMVSNLGRAKTLDRVVKCGNTLQHRKGMILNPKPRPKAYIFINTPKLGKAKRKHYALHVFVAKSFIPNPENKPQVNHIDGDKTNNNVTNLEWVTRSENTKHAWQTGLRKGGNTGQKNSMAKLTEDAVIKIRQISAEKKLNYREIGKLFNVSKECIYRIINNQTWKHLL